METSVPFAIFYIWIFYVHEIKAMTTTSPLANTSEVSLTTKPTSTLSETTEEVMTTQTELQTTTTTQSTVFSSTSSSTEIITTLPKTTHSFTAETSTTYNITSPTEPTTSTTEKLTPTTVTSTTSTEKITSTENASTAIPFVTQMTKSDKNEGVITALGTIAGISLVANVILSILLFRSCGISNNNINTTPMSANEKKSKNDQTEMYTELGNKEDGGAYQTLTHRHEVVYINTNTSM